MKRSPALSAAGLDKTGTPLVKLPAAKPTGIVQPSPQKDTSKLTGQSTSPPASSGATVSPKAKSMSPPLTSSSSGGGSGGTSPALREFSIPLRKISSATPTKSAADKTDVAKQQTVSQPQRQATPTPATTSLRFTPRQITAPSAKPKKLVKASPTAQSSQEAGRSVGEGKAATNQQAINIAASIITSGKPEAKAGSGAGEVMDSKPAPSFKAIQSQEQLISPSLPQSSGIPSVTPSPLGITPFSLKTQTSVTPKVAMVQPQPQARGKPVARVRPNPHHQEGKEEQALSKDVHTTPGSSAPHMNSVTPWKVRDTTSKDAFGPTLPEGLEYNSSAHGWNVSTLSGGEEGKAKKHKKKKKHRRRDEDRDNESDGEREGRKERYKKDVKKSKCRDVSRSPERSHHHDSHHSPERRSHYHGTHHTPSRTPHHDKHRRHKRYHGHRERDSTEHTRRHKYRTNHYSHRDRSHSSSRSRSRSPAVDTEGRHRHRERHRTPPPRHAHSESEGEGYRKSKSSGHHSEHSHHRGRRGSDMDSLRHRERKRSHQNDGVSDDEHEHKKHKRSSTGL